MQTWSVISQKGGSGKTTFALHLGVFAGQKKKRCVIIDLDPQMSAEEWSMLREDGSPAIVAGSIEKLAVMIGAARDAGADLVIVDTPPKLERTSIEAAKFSDLIIVPTRPSILDLPANKETIRIIGLAGQDSKAVIVLNAVAASTSEGKSASAALKSLGLSICPHMLGERADFRAALAIGLGVTEAKPKGKAAKEITALYRWLMRRVSMRNASAKDVNILHANIKGDQRAT